MQRTVRSLLNGAGYALSIGILSVFLGTSPRPAHAKEDAFPSRPIKIVVPWSAGGLTDTLARSLAQKLTEHLGQSVVVDNRPGASGAIGTGIVAEAPPDGYTLLIANTDTHAMLPALHSKLAFDPATAFTPISRIGSQAVFLWVNQTVPAKTAQEFLALAKSAPDKVSFASWGNGTVAHLAAEMLSRPAGIKMVHVPYKGASPAVMDVVAGRVDSIFVSIAGAGDNRRSGKLRPLAASSKTRSRLMPDVPTVAELGIPDFEIDLWYGLAAPTGTPANVIARLNEAVRVAVASEDMVKRFGPIGLELGASTPEEFGSFIAMHRKGWAKVVQEAGIKTD